MTISSVSVTILYYTDSVQHSWKLKAWIYIRLHILIYFHTTWTTFNSVTGVLNFDCILNTLIHYFDSKHLNLEKGVVKY